MALLPATQNGSLLGTDGDPSAERRQLVLLTAATGCVAAAGVAVALVSSLAPSERARAMGAGVEVDIGDLPPGGVKTVEWRGKPVWIMRRTPEMLAALPQQDAALADPASPRTSNPSTPATRNAPSAQRCLSRWVSARTSAALPPPCPQAPATPAWATNGRGGFFCPCHGSTFDLAGRVFKNKPAPTNLEVPPHRYVSDTRLLIGDDAA